MRYSIIFYFFLRSDISEYMVAIHSSSAFQAICEAKGLIHCV